jgi:hypothetical protein
MSVGNNFALAYVQNFVFNTSIDPTSLAQEDNFRIYKTFIAPREESYAIESDVDLDAFNHTLDVNEQVFFTDLNTSTYFLIRDPGCPDYFYYSHHIYSNNVLTINLDHFHEPNVVCPAVIEELYIVFKANKNF